MGVVAVKSCRDATVELEFTETAFDEITLRIKLFVVPILVFAGSFGGNNRLHSFGSLAGERSVTSRDFAVSSDGSKTIGAVSRISNRCRVT
jgi:hypothetical protein